MNLKMSDDVAAQIGEILGIDLLNSWRVIIILEAGQFVGVDRITKLDERTLGMGELRTVYVDAVRHLGVTRSADER